MVPARALLLFFAATTLMSGCGPTNGDAANLANPPPIVRRGFVGAFFRPQGLVPYGVFSVYSKNRSPEPYPELTTKLFGAAGYCDAVAANGVSISSGYLVDTSKLANILSLGVRWTRVLVAPFFDDLSHVAGPQQYIFTDVDSAQCALVRHHIAPMLALEAGPVQYDAVPGQYSPKSVPQYKTAADFGRWCSVVVTHERKSFSMVHRYSLPGNEVNTYPEAFPGGEAGIAAYSEACYKAVKAADPHAYVYGFEVNMDRHADPVGFVQRMYDLGCKPGTCYDGLSIHLTLNYPIPAPSTPCHPAWFGKYSLQCVADIQHAAHARIHILIGETVYPVPRGVPDEATKARAVVAAFEAFARDPDIDGVLYANVDECDVYPSGYFVGGCLVDSIGTKLPAYTALQRLAARAY